MLNTTHFAGRIPAWQKVGTVVPDGTTVQEAYETAGLLGWNIRKSPVATTVITESGVSNLEIKGQFAVIRDSEAGPTVIGAGKNRDAVVGPDYKVVQNEETLDVLSALVDAGDLKVDTVGALENGRVVWTSVQVPDGIEIDGDDPLDLFLLARNTNDGSGSFWIGVTPYRPICSNTLNLAIKGARNTYRIRHTVNVKDRIAAAREALQVTFTYRDAFAAEVERLLDTEVTRTQFNSIVEGLIPLTEGDSARAKTFREKAQEQRATLTNLFTSSATTEAGRGTAWAAYNAVTEYADWYLPIKGADADGSKRAARALTSVTVDTFKSNAVALLERVTA